MSYVYDPKKGKKYFFSDLTKTNICGVKGNIVIGDQQWERDKFNLPIFLSDKTYKIDDNFLCGCSMFDHEIVVPDSCFWIGDNFLYNCKNFNSNLVLSSNIKKISNNFMCMCSSFDGKGKIDFSILKNLSQIGDNFMCKCGNFNGNDIVFTSDKLLNVGKLFLSRCYKFNSNICFRTPLLSEVGSEFLSYCYDLNRMIDLSKCDCLKSLPSRFLYHCEKFNSELKFPKNLEKIGPEVMNGCREYNYDNFSSQKLPNSLKRINCNFLYGCEKYNHDFVVPLNTKIDGGFLHNCYSMESTIDLGLNNISDTLEQSYAKKGTLSCEIPKMKNLAILKVISQNKDTLSIFKNAVENEKNCFDDFKFIIDNNDKSNDINDIFSVMKWFLDDNIMKIITNSDSVNFKDENDFINLLIYSWKLKQILDYSFKKNSTNKEYINKSIISFLNSSNIIEKLQKLHTALIEFCRNYKYFLSGVKLKTLDNKTSYYRNIEKINGESWRYTDQQNPLLHEVDDISGFVDSLFGYANINYANLSIKSIDSSDKKPWKPSSELSELKLINWLYDFIVNSVINDDNIKDKKLKDFIIAKLLDLNNNEMELFKFYLHHFIPLYFLDKKICDKFKNNFNEILRQNSKLNETLKIDFNYSLLPSISDRFVVFVDYLNLVTKLVQKDGKDKYYRYAYNAINKIKEIIDEKDRLIIFELLNRKDFNFTSNQWLTYLSLTSLIDKQDLIETLVDENFDFDYNQSNIIKKLNGNESISLNDFEANIFGQIQNQLLIDILYSFSDVEYDKRSCLEDFIKQLFEEKFVENWFEKITQKNIDLDDFFAVDKLFDFFKKKYWNEKVNGLDGDDYNRENIWDNYKSFVAKFANILCKNFNHDNIIVVAKNIMKKNFLLSLINGINKSAIVGINKFANGNEFKEKFVNDLKSIFGSFDSNKLVDDLVENQNKLQTINNDLTKYNWAAFMLVNNFNWDNLVENLKDQNWQNQNNKKLQDLADNLNVKKEELNDVIINLNDQMKNEINDLVNHQNKFDIDSKLTQLRTEHKQIITNLEKYYWAIFMFKNNFNWDNLVENLKDQNWQNQNNKKLQDLADNLNVKKEELNDVIINLNSQKKEEINDLIRMQKLCFDVYGNCEFLFEKNRLFKNVDTNQYTNKLLDIIYDCKFIDKSKVLLLYLYVFNIDYNLWIDDEIKFGKTKDFFVNEVVKKNRKNFYDKLKEEFNQFYDDEYDDYSEKMILKDLYDNFIEELFTIKDGESLENTGWFDDLFSLGQNDEKLKKFINVFITNKNSEKLRKLGQYGDLYNNFKYEIISIFKKVLADILKQTNIPIFIDISNNIFLEDSFALKICMLLLKMYDEKILNIKNNKNFCDDIYDSVSSNDILLGYKQFVSKKTNIDLYPTEIIKQIKSYKNRNWFNFETIIKKTTDILDFFKKCESEFFLEQIHNLDKNFFALIKKTMAQNENRANNTSNVDINQQIEAYKRQLKKIDVQLKDLLSEDDVSDTQVWELETKKRDLTDDIKKLSRNTSYDFDSLKEIFKSNDINNDLLTFIRDYCNDVKDIFEFIFKYDNELWDMKSFLGFDYEMIYDSDGENPQTGYYFGEDGSENDGIILKNLFNFIANNFNDSILKQINIILFDIDNLNYDNTSSKYDKKDKYLTILSNFIQLFNLFSKERIVCECSDKYINEKFPGAQTLIDILAHIKEILIKNNKKYLQKLSENGSIFDVYSVYKILNQNFKSYLSLRRSDLKEGKKIGNDQKINSSYVNKTAIEIFIEKCKEGAKKDKSESGNKSLGVEFDEYINLIDVSDKS